jgi:hypothetical protein
VKITLLAVIALIIGGIKLKQSWNSIQVRSKGEIVRMAIIALPSNCETTGPRQSVYMQVSYLNKIYHKKIPTDYCQQHKIGDSVALKYLSTIDEVVFPEEKFTSDIVATSTLLVAALLLLLLTITGIAKPKAKQ